MEFVCLECKEIFEEPKSYKENQGEHFGAPAYEHYSGCPYCGGAYVEARYCDCCGECITDNYIKIGYKRYCNCCFDNYELGDED